MKHDSDASVDQLLAGTLKARARVAPDGACLDAETLGAWADGALDVRERASAEAHAADCARCQALLAAMVRTLPPPAAAKSPWRLPALGWLVPLTAAAIALTIWVAVPKPGPPQRPDAVATIVDQVAPAAPPAPRANEQAKAAAEPEPQGQVAGGQTASASARPPVALRERQETGALEKKEASPAPPTSASAPSEVSNVARAAPPVGAVAVPNTMPGAPPSSSADVSARREAASAPSRLSAFANRMENLIVSSNPATRFRLLPGGGVQRSADGGSTWRTEVTGTTETLTAGASPSPSVCWLVGISGTVLLSTDGRSWRRLTFPEVVDLRSVSATDNETATVTTVDGRAFVTTDGGQTWSRSPGL